MQLARIQSSAIRHMPPYKISTEPETRLVGACTHVSLRPHDAELHTAWKHACQTPD